MEDIMTLEREGFTEKFAEFMEAGVQVELVLIL